MATIDAPTIAAVQLARFVGTGYRQIAPKYDPRSGEGARMQGGRFNPPDSFPVLYICTSRACAVAEFVRFGSRLALGPEGLLPRSLFTFDVEVSRVLDLCDELVRQDLDVQIADLVDDDRSLTREIGIVANGLGLQAIRSPSAAGVHEVLALLPEQLGSGKLDARLAETWETMEDVTEGSR